MKYRSATTSFGILLAGLSLVLTSAQSTAPKCSPDNLCPKDTPCCSLYGQCGIGAYCLGGCDPKSSFSLDSCMPHPICSSHDYRFTNLDSLTNDQKYLGDASKTGWVYSGIPKTIKDEAGDEVMLMTMPKDSVGTLLGSSSYIWYGKITATLRTSRSPGVVTAFILMSDVKDEIDFEFVGYDTNQAQTNFYWQGVTNYTNGRNHSVEDTFDKYHTYEIDWTPDSITWSIDGKSIRQVNRADTFNATTNTYAFPQSPSRAQLSLWPVGTDRSAPGTIAWAGGMVDWNYPDVQKAGYFYALVKDVNIECYNPPGGAKIEGNKAYIYGDMAGLNTSIRVVDANTILKSLQATGLQPDVAGPDDTDGNGGNVPGGQNGANANQGGESAVPNTNDGGEGNASPTWMGFSQGLVSSAPGRGGEMFGKRGWMLAVFLVGFTPLTL